MRRTIRSATHPGEMTDEGLYAIDPDGRTVIFGARSRLHLELSRPWMLDHVDAILATVARPDFRAEDPIPGREHFYRRHIDLKRWLRVVVECEDDPGHIVTALVQSNPPRDWNP
jgi:hypothetical protein